MEEEKARNQEAVKDIIEKRRAYRSLKKIKIEDNLIYELSLCASLAPSCYNKQPWRFLFIKSKEKLELVFQALPDGNKWAKEASMVIAVYSSKENDCVIKEREYYLFDTGMSVGFLILRATEMGLVAHPIAGYDPDKVKDSFSILKDANLITLVIVGTKDSAISENLSEWQKEQEEKRPKRMDFSEFTSVV